MIIRGQAGSGKSTLYNTIVTKTRKISQYTNSAVVCAPTGGSANKAGDETIQKLQHAVSEDKISKNCLQMTKIDFTNCYEQHYV